MSLFEHDESTGRGDASFDGSGPALEIFSACPASVGDLGRPYLEQVREVARWSEDHGCSGILIYCDNRLVDPWLLAQVVVASTERLAPLVAVQPVYMHPYALATMIATFASLHERRVYVNWVAGGFKNDLEALADTVPHDERYERLVEYATLVRRLTDGEQVTHAGKYFAMNGLALQPAVEPAFSPSFMVSGSSPAGAAAARSLAACPVTYALPAESDGASENGTGTRTGLRLGLIARSDRDTAWQTAFTRFPPNRKGALTRAVARKVSDSHWHEQLCRLADERAGTDDPYWMVPFDNYKTMCPYLVGTHDEVGETLARYVRQGVRTFILDEPETEADLEHANIAFDLATSRAATGTVATA